MNKVENGQLNAPNIQLGSATGFIKLCLQLERANDHLVLEHAVSVSGTLTPPPNRLSTQPFTPYITRQLPTAGVVRKTAHPPPHSK
jgi:hypothetical protein